MIDHILDPLDFYNTASERLVQHAEAHFDRLVLQSGIDIAGSRDTAAQYDQAISEAKQIARRSAAWLAAVIISFFVAVCTLIIIVVMLFDGSDNWISFLLLSALSIACIVLPVSFALPNYKTASARSKERQKHADFLLEKAWAQMEPLNALFTDHDIHRLVEKTMDGLEFLPHCTGEHIVRMAQQKGFREPDWSSASVRNVQAGFLNGNSFLFTHLRTHYMVMETYTGSCPYTWTEEIEVTETYYETEYYRDKQGNQQERQVEKTRKVKKNIERSDTLYDEISSPAPCYASHSTLGYVHPAAPDLTFSRSPVHAEKMEPARREQHIRRQTQKLQRRSERAIRNGGSFQPMHNGAFESLFAAVNRNHEVQFRMLFTPAAQRNMEQLLTSTEGYGDDFHFLKDHCYNEIRCGHTANGFSSTAAVRCRAYSPDLARQQFIDLNKTFFKEFFFCLAPLLAIPAYLEPGQPEEVPSDAVKSHFSRHEHESIANALPRTIAAPEGVTTTCMLHAKLLETTASADIVRITAQGYQAVERRTYTSKRGKDGKWHDVPIDWTEYIPREKTFTISVERADKDDLSCDARLHGLAAKIIPQHIKED